MSDYVIVPSGKSEDFVPLARVKSGRLFKKHLLSTGTLIHPATNEEIPITEDFLGTIKTNFEKGVCDTVAIPLANEANQHSEDPDRNIGEVIGVEVNDGKLYAVMDIRDENRAEKLGKTYLGASAMLHMDYVDTSTGERAGPTLLHAAITNRPYVTGLEDYQEIKEVVAATSDRAEDAVMLRFAVEAPPMQPPAQRPAVEEKAMADEITGTETQDTAPAEVSLDDLLATLKNKFAIDVPALQTAAAQANATASLSKALSEALEGAGVVKLSNNTDDKVSNEDIVGAIKELAADKVALTNRVGTLERQNAESEINTLISAGRVLPAQKDAMVELKLSNQAMFDKIVPSQPIVKLDNEKGATPPEDDKHKLDIDAEIARLTNEHLGMPTK